MISAPSKARKRRKVIVPTLFMDGIALCFLMHYVLMIQSVSSIFIRLSYGLLPLWLFFALVADGRHQFWKAITHSKSVFIGLASFSAWLFGEVILKRSSDAHGAWNWPIMTALPVYMLACYYGFRYPARFWRILLLLIVILCLQAAFSIPSLIAGTWSPRMVMHALEIYGPAGGKSFISEAARHCIGGYDLYMNVAIISSITVGFALTVRNGKFKLILWMLGWAFLVLSNILSTFTASAIIAISSSLIVLTYAIILHRVTASSIVIIIALAGFAGYYTFDKFSHSASYQFTVNKASKIFESVEDGGLRNETTGRGEMLFESWDAFCKQPLVGYGPQGFISASTGTSIGGGHSMWLNTLVQYGVTGGIWYFIMIIGVGLQIWQAVKLRPGDLLAISFLSAYTGFLIYGIINTVVVDFIFFFVLYGGALALKKQALAEKKRMRPSKRKHTDLQYQIINKIPDNPHWRTDF